MNWFGNDPFDEIVKEFFGEKNINRNNYRDDLISGEEEDRNIDYVESEEAVFLIFELPGFESNEVKVEVNGKNLVIRASKKNQEMPEYMKRKLSSKEINKKIPDFVKLKSFEENMKNGVLEIKFERKKK